MILFIFLLVGCTSVQPPAVMVTATQQMLISQSTNLSIDKLDIPNNLGKVYLDITESDGNRYSIAELETKILLAGDTLVDTKSNSDTVIIVRTAAQSINHDSVLIGIPAIPIPVPLAGTIESPELALFKNKTDEGITIIGLTMYNTKTGKLIKNDKESFGISHHNLWTIFVFLTWQTGNIHNLK